jgi:NTE family protein
MKIIRYGLFPLVLSVALLLGGCTAYHVTSVANVDYDALKLTRKPLNNVRVALALGGGGARGYATLGVLSVLQNQNVPIDLIAGTSAGSIMGALYARDGDAVKATNQMMNAEFFDIADRNLLNMSGDHLTAFIAKNIGADTIFSQLKVPLLVVTTDMKKGESFVIDKGLVAPAVTASSSVQGMIQAQKLYGRYLNDGGLLMNVPVQPLLDYRPRPKVIIAVNIGTDPYHTLPYYRVDILRRSVAIMMRRLTALQEKKADIVIHPELWHASMYSMQKKQFLFDMGEKATCCLMGSIRARLKIAGITINKPNPAKNICKKFDNKPTNNKLCKVIIDRNTGEAKRG